MDTLAWPTEWLRGVLDVCVLAVLADGPTYGYAISARLDVLGLGAVKGGTLYPLLSRLEQADLVTTEWRPGVGGPGRKYFALTTAGRDELRRLGPAWTAFTQVTRQIVDAQPDDAAPVTPHRTTMQPSTPPLGSTAQPSATPPGTTTRPDTTTRIVR